MMQQLHFLELFISKFKFTIFVASMLQMQQILFERKEADEYLLRHIFTHFQTDILIFMTIFEKFSSLKRTIVFPSNSSLRNSLHV